MKLFSSIGVAGVAAVVLATTQVRSALMASRINLDRKVDRKLDAVESRYAKPKEQETQLEVLQKRMFPGGPLGEVVAKALARPADKTFDRERAGSSGLYLPESSEHTGHQEPLVLFDGSSTPGHQLRLPSAAAQRAKQTKSDVKLDGMPYAPAYHRRKGNDSGDPDILTEEQYNRLTFMERQRYNNRLRKRRERARRGSERGASSSLTRPVAADTARPVAADTGSSNDSIDYDQLLNAEIDIPLIEDVHAMTAEEARQNFFRLQNAKQRLLKQHPRDSPIVKEATKQVTEAKRAMLSFPVHRERQKARLRTYRAKKRQEREAKMQDEQRAEEPAFLDG